MSEENLRLIDFNRLTPDQMKRVMVVMQRAVDLAKQEQAAKDVEIVMKSLLFMVLWFVAVYGLGLACDWW